MTGEPERSNAPRHGALPNANGEHFTAFRIEQFAVIEAAHGAFPGKDNGGCHHGAEQGSAAHFILRPVARGRQANGRADRFRVIGQNVANTKWFREAKALRSGSNAATRAKFRSPSSAGARADRFEVPRPTGARFESPGAALPVFR